ncbi:hypothetical protein SeMB42_g00247 [Synchytrium endobioticum]|uniref:Uncharacterized protein n=1 Tax=Synchytrium endobioticum TaxID=286115 RepID=A0A507CMB6_9FUNG|nr:hypothetical protein SeLEV6574_g06710 [Synchytrium endobioticum]TPX54462.1 hypothetical protein SeMB42_g00247 [Synchytrium endobioticum]
MGQRTNPLSLRLRTLINWPSSVRHPFLASYIRHIFQHYLTSPPGIRSSTNGIWVNLTVLDTSLDAASSIIGSCRYHPKAGKALQFRNVDLTSVLGRFERKVLGARKWHQYYSKLMPDANAHHVVPQMLLSPSAKDIPATLQALQIYRDCPIHLRMNVITNPLLNADILAQYVARHCSRGRPLARVYKDLLEKLG